MKDEVADFIAWLENPDVPEPAPAREPVARPELTQADIDRWMESYDPQRDWQDDAASDAQLGYLQSLLRRKGQASHMIDLLRD